MANRFDTALQVGVEANPTDRRRKDGRVLPDLNMAAPLDVRARVSRRITIELALEDQELREGMLAEVSEVDSFEDQEVIPQVVEVTGAIPTCVFRNELGDAFNNSQIEQLAASGLFNASLAELEA